MPAICIRWPAALLVVSLLLSACNYPGWGGTPQPNSPEQVLTAAARTIEAQLTQASVQTVVPSETPTPPGATPTVPGPTPTPSITPTLALCDKGAWVEDVNYPDDSEVEPGASFTKTWRIRNAGTCTWNPSYAIVFDKGDALGAPASIPLSATVGPEQDVDISIDFKAPETPGTYQGFWKLRNTAGQVFGLGSKADQDFWVKIQVGVVSGVTYDFLVQAPSASWASSGGGSGSTLTFGGADDDPNGVAKLKDSLTQENGKKTGVTLVMGPKHTDDGTVSGTFPEYTVRDGDHFRARIGFMKDCGSAKVIFQFGYQENGGDVKILDDWEKTCDGKLLVPDIDLSDLAGKKVQFVLAVLADGSAEGDLAIWGSPRIER